MRIAVTSPSFAKNATLCQELRSSFSDVYINTTQQELQGEKLIWFLKNAESAIIGKEKMSKYILQNCPNLRFISKYGVGMDNIDLEVCQEYQVEVGWTAGVNRKAVAEMTLSFMIGLCRNLYKTSFQLKNGTWNKNGGTQFFEKTIGILGVGNIGKELVKLLKPFNCTMLVNDIIDQHEYYEKHCLTEVSKEELFKKSDIITIHTPLTPKTKALVNIENLRRMKPSAFLINTARGEIIHFSDLKYAIEHEVIAGVALDVYDYEPFTDISFLKHPHVIATPHIGGNSVEAVLAMGRSAIQHLKNYYHT